MGFMRICLRGLSRVTLCATALGTGAALGRYTDVARSDLNLGPARARAAALSTAPDARRPGRETAPAQATSTQILTAIAEPGTIDEEELGQAPARDHDGMLHSMRNGQVIRGATPHRMILFTFDDGPDRDTTPVLLDRLDATGIHAVFFLTGSNLRGENVAERKNQRIAREAIARGHWLASHGMNHRQLPLLSDADALTEVVEVEQVFEKVFGQRPFLIRPPGGSRSARIDGLLAKRGYTQMLWNLGAGDFQVRTAEDVHTIWRQVLERRENSGERGGIILLHDTYSWSVEAFQLIVNDLLDRNCKLLAQNEELYDFVEDPRIFFQQRTGTPSQEADPAVMTEAELAARQARLREETAQRCAVAAQP
jgi:peptidoglycan/xylan/chitin deacetylase (PgdA/CDA1 family)